MRGEWRFDTLLKTWDNEMEDLTNNFCDNAYREELLYED